jgi:4-diphosphocytidyl-2-C-methyl-D-erythritol kinase
MIQFAPAKINIGLKVLNKRPDSYHNLDSVFYPIPLHDIIEFVKSDTFSFASSGLEIGDSIEQNLIVKAYNLMKVKHNIGALKIHLHKVIPMGAGLGGGSSDASITLLTINELFNLGLDESVLASYAKELGADCPFFIYQKPMRAMGIGDEFQKIDLSLKGKYILLIKPNIHISTQEAYSGVHLEGKEEELDINALNDFKQWKLNLPNSFEVHLFKKHSELHTLKSELYNQGAFYASMSGSGSSIFGLFDAEPEILKKWSRGNFVWLKQL